MPECWPLSKENWDYFFTIHPLEGRPLAWKENDRGDWERKHFTYRFINFLQAKLKIKKREYFWVATVEEEGKGKIPHLHFIFRFNAEEFEKRSKAIPDKLLVENTFKLCLSEMKEGFGSLDARIDQIKATEEDKNKVVSYFTKQDGFRKEKQFYWPNSLKKKKSARS